MSTAASPSSPPSRPQAPSRALRVVDDDPTSDGVLAARARDGDRRAVEALVERHEGRVHRLAHTLIKEREEAQDAAQEALARLVDRIGSYRGEAAFTTWLHRLTVNVCTDHARRLARRRRSEAPDVDGALLHTVDGAPRAVDVAVSRVATVALRGSLAALSEAQRTVVVLKDVLSLSYEEIAERLELPVGTVKSHAHRGRRALAERLGRGA